MDRVLSVRVDEHAYGCIGFLARRLHTSKKKVIEGAVDAYASKLEAEEPVDIFKQTFGAWKRSEPARQTVARVRRAFRQAMLGHKE